MKNTITYLCDTNYSFVKTTTREDGATFSRKIEKWNAEYGNVCMLFHRNNTAIIIGNTVSE